MKEQSITFETAKLAKEKGFKQRDIEVGFSYYKPDGEKLKLREYGTEFIKYCTPFCTQSLLQKWLRESHQISIKIDDFYTDSKLKFDYNICKLGSQEDNPKGLFETYEKALEEALFEALKLIK